MLLLLPKQKGNAGSGKAPALYTELTDANHILFGGLMSLWFYSGGTTAYATAEDPNRPSGLTETMNGLACVTFSSTDRMSLSTDLNNIANGSLTMFFVVKPLGASQCPILGSEIPGGDNKFRVTLDVVNGVQVVSFRCGDGDPVYQAYNYEDSSFIVCARRVGNQISICINDSIPTVSNTGSSIPEITYLYLGYDYDIVNTYQGIQAHIRMYKGYLTDTQVSNNFRQLALKWGIVLNNREVVYPSGLVLAYDYKDTASNFFNMGKFETVLDRSGNNKTLQQTNNSIAPQANGVVGSFTKAPSFTGSEWLRFVGAIGVSGSSPWTAVVVFNTQHTGNQDGPLVFGSSTFASGKVAFLDINITQDQNGFRTKGSGSIRYGTVYGAGGSFITSGVFSGGQIGNFSMYVNNVLKIPTQITTPANLVDVIDQNILIGASGTSPSSIPAEFWTGSLGFVGIWNRVLTAIELRTVYTALYNRFISPTSTITLEGNVDSILLENTTDLITLED